MAITPQPTKQRGNILLSGLLVILIVIVIALIGIGIKRRHDRAKTAANVTTTNTTSPTTTPATTPTATLPSGTDNQSLTTDLANVNGSLSQNGQSLNSANSAVNDQQSQITVPTN
jgi:hypothetical protein